MVDGEGKLQENEGRWDWSEKRSHLFLNSNNSIPICLVSKMGSMTFQLVTVVDS